MSTTGGECKRRGPYDIEVGPRAPNELAMLRQHSDKTLEEASGLAAISRTHLHNLEHRSKSELAGYREEIIALFETYGVEPSCEGAQLFLYQSENAFWLPHPDSPLYEALFSAQLQLLAGPGPYTRPLTRELLTTAHERAWFDFNQVMRMDQRDIVAVNKVLWGMLTKRAERSRSSRR